MRVYHPAQVHISSSCLNRYLCTPPGSQPAAQTLLKPDFFCAPFFRKAEEESKGLSPCHLSGKLHFQKIAVFRCLRKNRKFPSRIGSIPLPFRDISLPSCISCTHPPKLSGKSLVLSTEQNGISPAWNWKPSGSSVSSFTEQQVTTVLAGQISFLSIPSNFKYTDSCSSPT